VSIGAKQQQAATALDSGEGKSAALVMPREVNAVANTAPERIRVGAALADHGQRGGARERNASRLPPRLPWSRLSPSIPRLRALAPQVLRHVVVAAGLVAALALAGCGSSASPSTPAIEMRINRERAEAAADAHQEDKVTALEAEVHRLAHHAQATMTAVKAPLESSPASQTSASEDARVFHAPGGNVTCDVQTESATCSVASNGQTFVLPQGTAVAYIESGVALASGSGQLAGYGTSVSVGAITCVIPMESEPRGITCNSGQTGHGFEASRVPARQEVY
jgi:hypothetical protein